MHWRLKINDFLSTCVKMMREYNHDHIESFGAQSEPINALWRKVVYLLKEQERGPFKEIVDG